MYSNLKPLKASRPTNEFLTKVENQLYKTTKSSVGPSTLNQTFALPSILEKKK